MKRLLAVALVAAALIAPGVAHADDSIPVRTTVRTLDYPERTLRWLTNTARRNHGRVPLTTNLLASERSESHAWAMASRYRIFHGYYPREFSTSRCYGQNVGVGPTVRAVFRAFMRSDVHRRNILYRPFRQGAYGVARSRGFVWVVIDFRC